VKIKEEYFTLAGEEEFLNIFSIETLKFMVGKTSNFSTTDIIE